MKSKSIPSTIYIDETGPYICYSKDNLEIHDLNPQIDIRWRISKWELFKIGCKAIFYSIWSAQ